jgi:subtilisin family serine protease
MLPDIDGNDGETSEYSLEDEQDLLTNLDPELQNVIINYRSGQLLDPAISKTKDGKVLVDVIAELEEADGELPQGLTVTQQVGPIIIGTLEVERIESARTHPNIRSLKGARRIKPTLGRSVPEINGSQQQLRDALPQGTGPIDGSGVIVGIVDYGCDFSHPNFLKTHKTTRILSLWDQHDIPGGAPPDGFNFGREFSMSDLNTALSGTGPGTPLERLDYHVFNDAHGTHVMDIAAGNGGGINAPGVAPNSDIIFVDLFSMDFEDQESLGNSNFLMQAIKYIFDKAGQQPVVINVSINFDGGPHDGSTPVEKWIDLLLKKPGRAVVIAAGNSRDKGIHAHRQVQTDAATTLSWQIRPGDLSENKCEIWYKGTQQLEVFLVSPLNSEQLGPFTLGSTKRINRQGQLAGRVHHRQYDSSNGDNQIVFRFSNLMEPGTWKILLRSLSADPVDVHAWIEIDEKKRSRFEDLRPTDTRYTIGSIACGASTIVVGSYNPDSPSDLPFETAEGPTRDGKLKPEISAPGNDIESAQALTNGTETFSGTSAAAPHVTGVVALLMQAAGEPLPIEETRRALTQSVRHHPPAGPGWDSNFGTGRLDATATVQSQVTILELLALSITETVTIELLDANAISSHSPELPSQALMNGTQRKPVPAQQIELSAETELHIRGGHPPVLISNNNGTDIPEMVPSDSEEPG